MTTKIKQEVPVCSGCGFFKCLCNEIDKAIAIVKAIKPSKPINKIKTVKNFS